MVESTAFSGDKATIYSVRIDDAKQTLFEEFIDVYFESHHNEVNEIIGNVEKIGFYSGAQEYFLKVNEGKPGDGVSALFDKTEKLLRVYCIRFGLAAIIIGGGATKPKHIRSRQEDKSLSDEAGKMIWLSNEIYKRMLAKEIVLSDDGKHLDGNLIFETQ